VQAVLKTFTEGSFEQPPGQIQQLGNVHGFISALGGGLHILSSAFRSLFKLRIIVVGKTQLSQQYQQ